jgi:hypothetical protein
MMQQETGAMVAKSIATGAAAAFGLTPIAFAAAIVGALVSLHFEPPATGSTLWRMLGQIAALAVLAALLASLSIALLPSDAIPVAARSGLLGIFANPCYQWGRAWIDRKRNAGEPPGGN